MLTVCQDLASTAAYSKLSRRHVLQPLGTPMHRIRVRRDEVPRRGNAVVQYARCRQQWGCSMKLRLALGIGALALLIAGLSSWDGFDRPTLSGHILIVGPAALPPLTASEDDVGAFSLCVPRGGTMFVHVLPFTRVLDARGRLFTTTTSVAALQPGQRIQIWAIGETNV